MYVAEITLKDGRIIDKAFTFYSEALRYIREFERKRKDEFVEADILGAWEI